ncbi:hypothetical protein [Endozoicomonas sp. Mp262]|uniref:P-loop ATPase, Sll1717 family n=1 Tax=Endozoicomonas sp. Mp262 TaxID=2919499 RepID=UPI0021D9398C
MKRIRELFDPSIDAINYNTKENKEFFISSYLKTSFLDKALKSNCYYTIGEKGSGKTALAFHFQNTAPNGVAANLVSINETQYKRFIKLKEDGKLSYTDYSIIWRATLLYLISKTVIEKKKKWHHKLTKRFSPVEKAIKDYDTNSQVPELEYVIEFATSLTSKADLNASVPTVLKASLQESGTNSTKTTVTEIKTALLDCEKKLKTGIQDIKLDNDIILFIDGIDAKPNGITFDEYKNCLIGLSEAAWHLNSEFFPNIKDTKGRLRINLLLRPDVFNSLNIHNSNCKLKDNSVILNWSTSKERHKNSDLFKMSDKYFSSQNRGLKDSGWEHYFPYPHTSSNRPFVEILNKSFHRPRDIFSSISILIEIFKRNGKGKNNKFEPGVFHYSEFTDEYYEYLLGEVKNYANFYMTNEEFEKHTGFFQCLNGGAKFDYHQFISAHENFIGDTKSKTILSSQFTSSPEAFLQFWYDVNVIGYKENIENENDGFYRWSYRERSIAKVMPKVKLDSHYMVHPGVAKSLNIGKKFVENRRHRVRET